MTTKKGPQPWYRDHVWLISSIESMEDSPISVETLELWESEGRLFSVDGADGRRHYPHFQFQHDGQPFPVIRHLLQILQPCIDNWIILAWFRHPNSWILDETMSKPTPIAPSAAFNRPEELLRAAANFRGTYVA